MDDPKFEKLFVVYGDDETEAHYILSNLLMSKIVKLQQKIATKIALSFRDNKVFIALNYNKIFFEPSIKKSLLKENNLVDYIEILEMLKSIANLDKT